MNEAQEMKEIVRAKPFVINKNMGSPFCTIRWTGGTRRFADLILGFWKRCRRFVRPCFGSGLRRKMWLGSTRMRSSFPDDYLNRERRPSMLECTSINTVLPSAFNRCASCKAGAISLTLVTVIPTAPMPSAIWA